MRSSDLIHLGSRPPRPITRAYYPLAVNKLERLAGDYLFEDDVPLTISLKEERLWAQPLGRQPLELVPRSETEFFLRWTAGRIVFQVDQQQRPTGLKFHMGSRTRSARRSDMPVPQ